MEWHNCVDFNLCGETREERQASCCFCRFNFDAVFDVTVIELASKHKIALIPLVCSKFKNYTLQSSELLLNHHHQTSSTKHYIIIYESIIYGYCSAKKNIFHLIFNAHSSSVSFFFPPVKKKSMLFLVKEISIHLLACFLSVAFHLTHPKPFVAVLPLSAWTKY